MRLFPKQIMDENLSFVSSSEIDMVRKHVNILLNEKVMLRDSLNLTGLFTGEDKFELSLFSFVLIMRSNFSQAKLKVHFYTNEQGTTQFDLHVFPNSTYPTFFVVLPLLYAFILFSNVNSDKDLVFYIIVASCILTVSFGLLALSKISKNNLVSKCVALFQLQSLKSK